MLMFIAVISITSVIIHMFRRFRIDTAACSQLILNFYDIV